MSADEYVTQTPFHLETNVVFPHWKCVDNALWCMYEKKCAFACVWVGIKSTGLLLVWLEKMTL